MLRTWIHTVVGFKKANNPERKLADEISWSCWDLFLKPINCKISTPGCVPFQPVN